MTTDQFILFAIFGGVLVLLFSGKARHDLVAFAGLMRSGAVARLTQLLAKEDRPISLHVAVMGTIGGIMSGFMNNIAALAILMPIDMQIARKAGRVAGYTLMPLAFATILGGMLTLIGTPPNLIVSGFRQDVLGEPFRMFSFLPVGGAVALAGIAFVALIGWRLVPARGSMDVKGDAEAVRRYRVDLVVPPDSAVLDRSLEAVRAMTDPGDLLVISASRDGAVRAEEEVTLRSGDLITVEADSTSIDDFRSTHRLAYCDGGMRPGARLRDEGEEVIEVLVPANAQVRGESAAAMGLLTEHDTVLLGVRRRGDALDGDLPHRTLEAGDLLLLLTPERRSDAMLDALGVAPLDGGAHYVMREGKMALTVGWFVAAVVLTSFGLITMPVALGCVVIAYVVTGVLSVKEVYRHIDWSIVVLLASMIPLGLALDSVGGTALIAGGIVALTQGAPAWVALAVLMAVTMFLSDVLNNNATTIIAAPVGIRLAEQLEVNPDAFLMGVAVAAACAFLTPIGHQNNTLVLGPGEYRFGDFWRLGLPLEIIVMVVAVPMLLLVWPL